MILLVIVTLLSPYLLRFDFPVLANPNSLFLICLPASINYSPLDHGGKEVAGSEFTFFGFSLLVIIKQKNNNETRK